MGVSIWHWAILFLLIGVPVFVAVLSATKPSQNQALVAWVRRVTATNNSWRCQMAAWRSTARLPSCWPFKCSKWLCSLQCY